MFHTALIDCYSKSTKKNGSRCGRITFEVTKSALIYLRFTQCHSHRYSKSEEKSRSNVIAIQVGLNNLRKMY